MNRRVSPWAAASGMPGAFDPAVCAAADSRARTLVVPTAITRPPRAGGGDGVDGGLRHGEPFGVHDVVFQLVDPHRLEGARAHMQRDEGALHAQGVQLVQRGLIEVQAGGGRRDGAGFARVHGLVAGVVAGVGLVRDVGRQRRGAVGVQQVQHRTGKADVEQLALAAQHHGVEGVGQAQPHAGAGRLAGAHVGQGRGRAR